MTPYEKRDRFMDYLSSSELNRLCRFNRIKFENGVSPISKEKLFSLPTMTEKLKRKLNQLEKEDVISFTS